MRPRRNVWTIILGVTSLSVLGWLISLYPPSPVAQFIFFPLLLISFVSIFHFFTLRLRLSILAGIGISITLFLRAIGLRDPIYLFLLLACLISIEWYFRKPMRA